MSDEWNVAGKMFVGPDWYHGSYSAESEVSLWDEIQWRVKAQELPEQADP